MTTVQFIPQVWINDYAVEVHPTGQDTWDVGQLTPEEIVTLNNDSYQRDELRFHPNAPDWVQEWDGPFEVYILEDAQ